jgi:hypothetical protein
MSRLFRLILWVSAALLTTSCIFLYLPTPRPQKATLEVDINYDDNFYRETFQYSKEAENIQHFVLVVPEGMEIKADAVEIFHELLFQTDPDAPLIEDPSLQWALEYVYTAPGAHFEGDFEPGNYYVAVAFIAAPLTAEEAGVEEGVLYAGITGGGASTDYRLVELERGKTISLDIPMTDANGWACPWLYVSNGSTFERRTEVLRNVRGKSNEQTEITRLGSVEPVDGFVILKLVEEKDEMSFIDEFYLIVEGIEIRAEGAPAAITTNDGHYLTLIKGQSAEFRFELPESLSDREQVKVMVVVSGYYLPH